MIRVLFVCLGNVCRSPTAEAVFRHRVREAGLADRIEVDSAGTHDYQVGKGPDPRAQRAALARGVEMPYREARQVAIGDFDGFDYIVAMDRENVEHLKALCPDARAERIRLLMEFTAAPVTDEVPDPYYGNSVGFEQALDLIEEAAAGLLSHIRKFHRL